jgi:hypothetical protein
MSKKQIQQRQWDVICKMARYPGGLRWEYNIGYIKYNIYMYTPPHGHPHRVTFVVEDNDIEIKTQDLSLCSWIDLVTWEMLKLGYEDWKEQVLKYKKRKTHKKTKL